MKNIFYLCIMAIAFFSITIGCSKEDILTEYGKTSSEQTNISTDVFFHKQENNNLDINGPKNSTQNSTNDYTLYLNMDNLETQYSYTTTNPPLNGPFNVFFRNLMSNNFTIYSTQASNNRSCGNIERWVVNGDELNQFLVSISMSEEGFFRSWIGSNTNGNTSSTTNPDDKTKPKPNTKPTSGDYYNFCFGNSMYSN